MNKGVDRDQVAESDRRQADEAKVERSPQRPILPTCEENRSHEEKTDNQE